VGELGSVLSSQSFEGGEEVNGGLEDTRVAIYERTDGKKNGVGPIFGGK